MPFVTRSITSSFDGFASSRFGPTFPLAPAAASVWQLPQPASAKIALPSTLGSGRPAGLRFGLRANRKRSHRGDVGGDRLGVVAGDDVGRHAGQPRRRVLDGIGDLAADDGLDRRLADPVSARLAERVVQVRADHALCPGVGQRVALTALRLEQLLAVRRIASLREARGAATGRGQSRDQCREQGRACTCQPAQLHPRPQTPSSATRIRRQLPASDGS